MNVKVTQTVVMNMHHVQILKVHTVVHVILVSVEMDFLVKVTNCQLFELTVVCLYFHFSLAVLLDYELDVSQQSVQFKSK